MIATEIFVILDHSLEMPSVIRDLAVAPQRVSRNIGSLCESFVHLLLQIVEFRKYGRRASRTTRPRRSPVVTADHLEGTGHRVGTMHDGFEHLLDVRRDEHLPTNLLEVDTQSYR